MDEKKDDEGAPAPSPGLVDAFESKPDGEGPLCCDGEKAVMLAAATSEGRNAEDEAAICSAAWDEEGWGEAGEGDHRGRRGELESVRVARGCTRRLVVRPALPGAVLRRCRVGSGVGGARTRATRRSLSRTRRRGSKRTRSVSTLRACSGLLRRPRGGDEPGREGSLVVGGRRGAPTRRSRLSLWPQRQQGSSCTRAHARTTLCVMG